MLVVLAGGPPEWRPPVIAPAGPPVRQLARILAAAYLRLLAARKAASDGQNLLDVARGNKAPLASRRRARG